MIAGMCILRVNIFGMRILIMGIYCVLTFRVCVPCMLVACVANGFVIIRSRNAVHVYSVLTRVLGPCRICLQKT